MPARVLLLCGGRSAEHEVSLAGARSVLEAAGGNLDLTPVVIDRAGGFLAPAQSRAAIEQGRAEAGSGTKGLPGLKPDRFDVVFPLLHGPNGEDGATQGLLRLLGLPFVGSDVLGSAVAMDKPVMKTLLAAEGIPQVGFSTVTRARFTHATDAVLAQFADWPLPLFVKPANLGSSIGISRVTARADLHGALEEAFRHDRRVIVEEGLDDVRELELGLLGNDAPEASPVGEVSFTGGLYDYETKYTPGRARLSIPADVPGAVADECVQLAVRAFRALDLAGLARVDFFLAADGRVLLNEVNTMPGFTQTSMYPRLFGAAGYSYSGLLERLVSLALSR